MLSQMSSPESAKKLQGISNRKNIRVQMEPKDANEEE